MEYITGYLKDYLLKNGYIGLAEHVKLIIAIGLLFFGTVIPLCYRCSSFLRKQFQQHRLNRDLHPFFTQADVKKATDYYVPTKCQNISPSKEIEPVLTHAFVTKEKIIPFFLKKALNPKSNDDDFRFFIVLADSGMGKTTFMINMYLKYVSRIFRRHYKIKLLPLGFAKIDGELDSIENNEKENTILLLDAFDEDSEAITDYKKRMDELIAKTWRFRKVLITCRTQFFPSEEEEPKETGILKYGGEKGEHIFRKLYVSPFDDKDVRVYLRKRFPFYKFITRCKAFRIVRAVRNLLVRPMLLSYIDDLIESKSPYDTTSSIYRELINKWIHRESRRVTSERRRAFQKELFDFSKAIAVDIYRNRQMRNGFFIPGPEILPFAKKHNIALEEFEMKSRSLLNRNAMGEYKFSHKSILEYFLVLKALDSKAFEEELRFEGIQFAKQFYYELFHRQVVKPFLMRKDLEGFYQLGDYAKRQLPENFLDSAPYIKTLSLSNCERFPTKILGLCPQLVFLELRECKIRNIGDLLGLRGLKWLLLNNNDIEDIRPLNYLTNLIQLDLAYNKVTEIEYLNLNTTLEEFSLANNKIARINSVNGLKRVYSIDLSKNLLADIGFIEDLKHLSILALANNSIRDVSALKKLKRLTRLELNNNQISGIEPLKNMRNLGMLRISNNLIEDISPLKELATLSYLDISNNPITEIAPLAGLTNLVSLKMNGTHVTEEEIRTFLKDLPCCRIDLDKLQQPDS